jgi:hypothetical protein
MDGSQAIAVARYRRRYRRLLAFYPRRYRERFAQGMEQTFNDLCRERLQAGGRGFTAFLLWIFVETFAGIVRERATNLVRCAVPRNSTQFYRLVKFAALGLGALMVAGIVTLMILARGKDEDIAGIVAPALLVTIVSVAAAIAAAILQSKSERDQRDAG